MKRVDVLAMFAFLLGCSSPNPRTARQRNEGASVAAADSVWKARLLSSKCRRPPTYAVAKWPEFLTAKRQATIRVPTFLAQEPYQAAQELAHAGGRKEDPPYGTQWFSAGQNDGFAQLSVSAIDSVKLVYPGPPEPEESICLEQIDGARATVLDSNRSAAPRQAGESSNGGSTEDSVGLGPYVVFATMRFPDGLALQVLGTATSVAQKNELLAAIRTIHRRNTSQSVESLHPRTN